MQNKYSHLEVKRSPTHGKGLFARRNIGKGKMIGLYAGPRVRADGTYVLWVEADDGSYYGVRGENELRFLNHSSAPNAEFEDEELFALRKIGPGEEIFIHYGDEWEQID